jgi:hypothetical protein
MVLLPDLMVHGSVREGQMVQLMLVMQRWPSRSRPHLFEETAAALLLDPSDLDVRKAHSHQQAW